MAGSKEYFNRKLHSLLGVIPVTVFVLVHLTANHFATEGAQSFNKAANFMGNLPFRYFLELVFIFIPLVYHAIYGLYIAFQAKPNNKNYGYFRNWAFLLQRITGVLTLIFVAWHVWQTRIASQLGATVNFEMMHNILSNTGMLVFYIVGILSAVFHLANGLWSFCISWGITITPRSQKINTYVTMAIFVLLAIVGLTSIFAFLDPELANM